MRHRHDRQVDGPRDVFHRRVRRDRRDDVGLGVDGVDGAVKARGDQVLQHSVADGPGLSGGADDPDRPGSKERLQRSLGGDAISGLRHRDASLRRLDVQGDLDDPFLQLAVNVVAAVLKDAEHLLVFGQHLGDQAAKARNVGRKCQTLQQDGADTLALVGVFDQKGYFGLLGLRASNFPHRGYDRPRRPW